MSFFSCCVVILGLVTHNKSRPHGRRAGPASRDGPIQLPWRRLDSRAHGCHGRSGLVVFDLRDGVSVPPGAGARVPCRQSVHAPASGRHAGAGGGLSERRVSPNQSTHRAHEVVGFCIVRSLQQPRRRAASETHPTSSTRTSPTVRRVANESPRQRFAHPDLAIVIL